MTLIRTRTVALLAFRNLPVGDPARLTFAHRRIVGTRVRLFWFGPIILILATGQGR